MDYLPENHGSFIQSVSIRYHSVESFADHSLYSSEEKDSNKIKGIQLWKQIYFSIEYTIMKSWSIIIIAGTIIWHTTKMGAES